MRRLSMFLRCFGLCVCLAMLTEMIPAAYAWTPDTDLSAVSASFLGEDADDHAGYSVSGVGDVNGDGYDDFLISALGDEEGGGTNAGQVYLILGKASGWSMDMDLSAADASFWGEDASDEAGNPVSGVGDVNGDGYDDFLIGAKGDDDGGSNAGQAYLILGKASGWAMDTDLPAANASFWGEDADDRAGESVSGAGDVNGDGYDDFLIGAPYDDDGGSTYLILGKGSGWSMDMDLSLADASFRGEDADDHAGHRVSGVGDVNGDGYDDFLIGACQDDDAGSDAGQVYLILGKASGWAMDTNLSAADASFIGEVGNDEAGCSVSGSGDVNGDGYDDFLIGAHWNDGGGSNSGQVYLILGKTSGWAMDTDLSLADASFWGEDTDDNAGISVSNAGDVNGDGYDDILIGAFVNDAGGSSAGQVYLVLGKATGWSMDTDLSLADASFWGEDASDEAGHSVSNAGDVNGDGYDDILIGAHGNDDEGSNAGQAYLVLSDYVAPPGLADTPWPKFHHDNRNTGRSLYLGPQEAALAWSYTTGAAVSSSPAIGSDGTVYVGSNDGKVYALNPDGSLKWSYTTGDQVGSSPAIGSDGTIYVGSNDGKVYALNPDGSLKWSYTTGGSVSSSPAIGSDGTVYVASADRKVYALNPDGTLKWEYSTGQRMYSSPAIGSDGTIYIGSEGDMNPKVYAFNPDGSVKWVYETGARWIYSSLSIDSDGTLYITEWDHTYALNPDGTLKWSYNAKNLNANGSPAIGLDGTIYTGSCDANRVHAFNPDGTLKWTYPTGTSVNSSPAIGSDGTIYVGSNDTKVYALNPDGTLKWSYTTGGAVYSSPAIGSDGRLYVGSGDGNVYAFAGPSPGVPSISTVSPSYGPAAGSTSVTLTGANFGSVQGSGSVTFGDSTASITSWSDSQIVCVTSAHAAGIVDVVVTADNGQSGSKTGAFRYEDPNTPWTKLQVTDNSTEDTYPSIAVDGSGNVHLAWVGSDGNDDEIYYANNVGGSFGTPVNVSNNAESDVWCSISVEQDGTVHIVWNINQGGWNEGVIYYTNNSSGSFGTPVVVAADSDNSSTCLGVDINGKAHIVWIARSAPGPTAEIYYSDNVNGSFGPEVRLTNDYDHDVGPSIWVDGNGNAHVVYSTQNYPSNNDHGVMYTNNVSGSFGGPVPADTPWPHEGNPSLCIDSNGKAHIAFTGSLTGGDYEICYTNNVSGSFGSSTQITDNALNDGFASVVIDASGNAHIVWRGNDGGDDDIYYTNNTSGSFVSPTNISDNAVSDEIVKHVDRGIALHGTDIWVAYCSQEGSSDYEIWVATIGSTVTPLPTISGKVTYYKDANRPVPGVVLSLEEIGLGVVGTDTSDAEGRYELLATSGKSYRVVPDRDGSDASAKMAITLTDVAYLLQYKTGKRTIPSTYSNHQVVASEVREDGSITLTDAAYLLQYKTGKRTVFPTQFWRFVASDSAFSPLPVSGLPVHTYASLQSDKVDQDYVALHVGDTNGSWTSSMGKPVVQEPSGISVRLGGLRRSRDGQRMSSVLSVSPAEGVLGVDVKIRYSEGAFRVREVLPTELTEEYLLVSNVDEAGVVRFAMVNADPLVDAGEVPMAEIVFDIEDVHTDPNLQIVHAMLADTEGDIPMECLDIRNDTDVPLVSSLSQNYPNPFNPQTTIRFSVSEEASVSLRIYSSSGQLVRVLVEDRRESPGYYSVVWDGLDDGGSDVGSGVYFCRMVAGSFSSVKKVILLR